MLPPSLKFLFDFLLFTKAFILTPFASLFLSPGMMPLTKPSGPYLVGAELFQVVDTNRINAPFDDKNREFVIYCWYPAARQMAHKLPYLAQSAHPLKKEFRKETKLPSKVVDNIFAVETNAYLNAPAKEQVAPYPVIIISHGLGGFGLLHCCLAENLASRGYFVVGIDHTNFSTVSVVGNRTVWYDQLIDELFSSRIAPAELFKKSAELFQVPVGDINTTINYLEALNSNEKSYWYKQLDLSRLGLVGHSMGGISSLEVARNDERCKAVISLDGWLPVMNSTNAINKPLMIIFSDRAQLPLLEGTDTVQSLSPQELIAHYKLLQQQAQALVKNNGTDSYFITITGASHLAFCDFVLLRWPLTKVIPSRTAGIFSGQDPYPIVQQINTHVRTFFDRYLKKPANLRTKSKRA
jgi:dienelactone hydrolase